MRKECSRCGKPGQLGNSILFYKRGRIKLHLCWYCSATPYERRLIDRQQNKGAKRQRDK